MAIPSLMQRHQATPVAGQVLAARVGRKVVVGTVVHEDDEVVRLEDFTGAQWTLRRCQHDLVPATPRHQRSYRAAYARAALGALETQIRRSVEDAGPLGPARSRPDDPALRDLYRLVDTPLGGYWFKARSLPSQATLKAWHRLEDDQAVLSALLARYSCTVAVPRPGSLVPTSGELEAWRELRDEGLLDPEEEAELGALEAFWRAHPDADRGFVEADGSIRPRYRNVPR